MYKIYISILAILLVSCSTKIHYIGKSLPSTKNIEVFISENSIKQPFEYMGKGYLGGYPFYRNPNKIQKKAEKLGLEKGADAVLISDYYIPNTGGTNINSIYKTDSIARGTVTIGSTTISPTTASGFNILYLKYIR
jgi:hypothetical protein